MIDVDMVQHVNNHDEDDGQELIIINYDNNDNFNHHYGLCLSYNRC